MYVAQLMKVVKMLVERLCGIDGTGWALPASRWRIREGAAGMQKQMMLYWVAVLAAVIFLLVATSGFVLWLALPPGAGTDGGFRGGPGAREFIGLARSAWIDLHAVLGV
jgi:hypothetical protein